MNGIVFILMPKFISKFLNHPAQKLYIQSQGNDKEKALLTNAEGNIYSGAELDVSFKFTR